MQEGPVDLALPSNPDTVIKPELTRPVTPQPVPQAMLMASPGRLTASSQLVMVLNTDRVQTHIIVDRFYNGIEIQPGQQKEIDMLVSDIESFQKLARPNRGVYTSGHLMGKPLPQHPIRILNIPEHQVQNHAEEDEIQKANENAAAAAIAAAQTAQSEREAESRGGNRRR
jgi:hypothetical protein